MPQRTYRPPATPLFPDFKAIDLDDRDEIRLRVEQFEPYSDFNFVSLFGWSRDAGMEWSLLDENIVVRFEDYVDGRPFLSFLGVNHPVETLRAVTGLAQESGLDPTLRLVPEVVVERLSGVQGWLAVEDPANHDYIYDATALAECRASKFRGKRSSINRFLRTTGESSEVGGIDMTDSADARGVLRVFDEWIASRGVVGEDTQAERAALENLVAHAAGLDLVALGVRVDGQLRAFSIGELLTAGFGMVHYEKANVEYSGLFEYLRQQAAENLRSLGCRQINYQQDLGIEGIRRLKLTYHPLRQLKKYMLVVDD